MTTTKPAPLIEQNIANFRDTSPPKLQPGDEGYYPTCDNEWCRTKLQKQGDSLCCPNCTTTRLIEPGEVLGY